MRVIIALRSAVAAILDVWSATLTLGLFQVCPRVADMASRTQPEVPQWNRLGYGNSTIQKIRVQAK